MSMSEIKKRKEQKKKLVSTLNKKAVLCFFLEKGMCAFLIQGQIEQRNIFLPYLAYWFLFNTYILVI